METINLTEAAYLDAVTFEASKWEHPAEPLMFALAFALCGKAEA